MSAFLQGITKVGVCTAVLVVCSMAAADDGIRDLEPPEEAIVVSPKTQLMRGDSAEGTVPPGQLLAFIKAKGDWRYNPEFRGWVNVRDVVALDKAVDYFSSLIDKQATPAAFHHRGIAYAALGQWEESLADIDEAIQRGDTSSFVFYNRGLAHLQLDQRDEALKDFTQSITLNPENLSALLERGNLLIEQEHNEAALKDFDAAIAIAPESAVAHNHRGIGLRMLGRFEEAEAEYTKALKFSPQYSEAYANRAYVRCGLGTYPAAVEDYEAALKLSPNIPEFLNDYAWLLATCSDESVRNGQRAVELSKQACELLDEDDPDFLDTLGAAYARIGEFDEAIAATVRALKFLGKSEAAANVVRRLKLYENKEPFTEVSE
ncbi:MAG: tetratricopeptide repeat protein [Planctomycetaceae bacterium]|nr:tetratricopeptide repeat protein [Planctomycetaceae bacterium]